MTAKRTTKSKTAGQQTPAASDVEQAGDGEVQYSYIVGNSFGLKKVEYTAIDGLAMFEGDIILGTVDQMQSLKEAVEHTDPNMEEACTITGTQYRWPDGVVPFDIDGAMPDQQRVHDAIAHLEANTNVRLRTRATENAFVHFQGGTGCSSYVGRQGNRQNVTLGPGCDWPRAVHEIGHAIGLWHEQSREDRDNFVTIRWDNIKQDAKHNFNQHITDGDDVGPYDYDSLMHYGRRDFAIDTSKDTMTPTPNANQAIGQRNGLSLGDILAIDSIYRKKATLSETSPSGPALAERNGELLLGWIGTGNLRLNFLRSSDGLHFTNKVTLTEVSPNTMALVNFRGRFVVAWTGVGNGRINVMQSDDGVHWGSKVTLEETSPSSPALGVLGNNLCIAWRGSGNNRLNVMRSDDGVGWFGKVTLRDTTTSGPTLATLGSRLLLGWRGVGNNQLSVIRSGNGTTFSGKVILSETTGSMPHLHVKGNRVFLTWQGLGNRLLNVLSSPNGSDWLNKYTARENCIDGPALSSIGSSLVWGWTGTDTNHRLNTLLFHWG